MRSKNELHLSIIKWGLLLVLSIICITLTGKTITRASASQDEPWQLEITATGQDLPGGSNLSSIYIGMAETAVTKPVPQSPPPNYTVDIKIDGEDNAGDFYKDIRQTGSEREVWVLLVEVGTDADYTKDGYFPQLHWNQVDIGNIGAGTLELRQGDTEYGELLIDDMSTTDTYQTKEADGGYIPSVDRAFLQYTIIYVPPGSVTTTYYHDKDDDGFGDPNDSLEATTPPPNYVTDHRDCNDSNANINPARPEKCDGIDNNCNDTTDEGFNIGAPCSEGQGECKRGGVLVCREDGSGSECSAIPGEPAIEMCDGEDNNCDGEIDEDFDVGLSCTVGTGACQREGITVCQDNGMDTECNVAAGEPHDEVCDGEDNDCDGEVDEEGALDCEALYRDEDHDGYGVEDDFLCLCGPQGLYSAHLSGDCDDSDVSRNQGRQELLNAKDDNCNGTIDDGFDPSFITLPNLEGKIGRQYLYTAVVKGETPLTNSNLEGKPSWMSLEVSQNKIHISGIPREADSNTTLALTLRVSNKNGTASQKWQVHILPVATLMVVLSTDSAIPFCDGNCPLPPFRMEVYDQMEGKLLASTESLNTEPLDGGVSIHGAYDKSSGSYSFHAADLEKGFYTIVISDNNPDDTYLLHDAACRKDYETIRQTVLVKQGVNRENIHMQVASPDFYMVKGRVIGPVDHALLTFYGLRDTTVRRSFFHRKDDYAIGVASSQPGACRIVNPYDKVEAASSRLKKRQDGTSTIFSDMLPGETLSDNDNGQDFRKNALVALAPSGIGSYCFFAPSGSYSLLALAQGYKSEQVKIVSLQADQNVPDILFATQQKPSLTLVPKEEEHRQLRLNFRYNLSDGEAADWEAKNAVEITFFTHQDDPEATGNPADPNSPSGQTMLLVDPDDVGTEDIFLRRYLTCLIDANTCFMGHLVENDPDTYKIVARIRLIDKLEEKDLIDPQIHRFEVKGFPHESISQLRYTSRSNEFSFCKAISLSGNLQQGDQDVGMKASYGFAYIDTDLLSRVNEQGDKLDMVNQEEQLTLQIELKPHPDDQKSVVVDIAFMDKAGKRVEYNPPDPQTGKREEDAVPVLIDIPLHMNLQAKGYTPQQAKEYIACDPNLDFYYVMGKWKVVPGKYGLYFLSSMENEGDKEKEMFKPGEGEGVEIIVSDTGILIARVMAKHTSSWFMKSPAVAPAITSSPLLSAQVEVEYTYSPAATGDSPMIWSLENSPLGMFINSTTGKIVWTPQKNQAGDHSVTLSAENDGGFDTQTWTVTVTDSEPNGDEDNDPKGGSGGGGGGCFISLLP